MASEIHDRSAVVPAALAALAEAGVLLLPIEALARNTPVHPTGGPLEWYPLFLVLFAAGTAAATLWRGRRRMPAVAAGTAVALAVVQVAAWGDGWGGLPFAIALFLGACVRVVTLATRDWRDPVDASFGWGAGILVGELAFARVAGWGAVLAPVVVVFFAGSLASRAASVRLAEAGARAVADLGDDRAARRWRVMGAVALGVVVLVPLGFLLGSTGGPMAGISRWLFRGLVFLIYLGALVLAFLLRPVVWLLHLVGVDAGGFRRGIERLGHRLQRLGPRGASSAEVPAWERLLGLLGLAAVVAGLVWFIVRQRQRARRALADLATRDRPDEGISLGREARPRGRRRPRRELPEDSVRRLYAQALIELEKGGRPRPEALTPGEYLRRTARDLPDCAPGLTVLTRAYEDVRYGRLVMDARAVDSLEAEWAVLSKAIREAPPPAPADDEAAADDAGRPEGADRSAPSTDATFGRR